MAYQSPDPFAHATDRVFNPNAPALDQHTVSQMNATPLEGVVAKLAHAIASLPSEKKHGALPRTPPQPHLSNRRGHAKDLFLPGA